jgi:MFS family permease
VTRHARVLDRPARSAMLAPLRHRPYRLLLGGQVVSDLGDWLDIIALLTLIVYRWELGPAAVGVLLTVMSLPFALLGPAAGVWADRWSRRRVMVGCDLARTAVVLGLLWAPSLPVVLALVATKQTFSTLFLPARAAAVRATVPAADLLAAGALGQLSLHSGRILAPALGGLVVVALGPRGAFAVDAATFLISAALLSRLPPLDPEQHAAASERRFVRELRQGIAHITGHATLALAVGSMLVAAFLIRATDVLFPSVFKGLGIDEGLLGPAMACIGAGYLAGIVGTGQWGRRCSPFAIMGLAWLEVGALSVALGAAAALGAAGMAAALVPAALFCLMLNGIGFAAMTVTYTYVLQRETPPDLMGRVTGAVGGLTTAVPLVAPLLVAPAAGRVGVGMVYAVLGGALVLLGAATLVARRRVHGETAAGDPAAAEVPVQGPVG